MTDLTEATTQDAPRQAEPKRSGTDTFDSAKDDVNNDHDNTGGPVIDAQDDMEHALLLWVADVVLPCDDGNSLAAVLHCTPLRKPIVLDMLCEAVGRGASACIRTLTPFTGPMAFAW